MTRDAYSATGNPFTPGRYVIAWCNAADARDPILLTSQVKVMRDGFTRAGHRPALVIVVVADGEQDAAVARVTAALDGAVTP